MNNFLKKKNYLEEEQLNITVDLKDEISDGQLVLKVSECWERYNQPSSGLTLAISHTHSSSCVQL